jgi:hypothetical protein
MKKIDIIIPLHTYDDYVKNLLARAIESVPEENRIIIVTQDREIADNLNWLVEERKSETCTVVSPADGVEWKSDFCSLVNEGVNACGSEWFSILEFDDTYTDIWFKNVEKYIEYKPEVSVFLPLEELVDYSKNQVIGYGNEAPWASSFSNEIGYIDNDCLQQYFDFYLTGSIFNVEDWKNYGGLKPSIKISFWYEFLLRMTNKGKKVFVIPKLGYKHYVDRENSLYDIYRKTIDEKESNFYFELAKQESLFKEDRNKTYENNVEKGE